MKRNQVKPAEEVTVNLQLPPRRRHTTTNFDNVEESFTLKRPPSNGNPARPVENSEDPVIINKTDSLAERVRKMQMMKRQGSLERESSREGSIPTRYSNNSYEPLTLSSNFLNLNFFSDQEQSSTTKRQDSEAQPVRRRRQTDPLPPIPDDKPARSRPELPPIPDARARSRTELPPVAEAKTKTTLKKPVPVVRTTSDSYTNSKDVQFLMQVKDNRTSKSKYEDALSTTTDTTETTLIDRKESELKEENEMLKRELDTVKARCERAERDKSDILLRRLASMDTTSNKTAAGEALKLQQKVNEMKQQMEDLQDEKKALTQKVKELTTDMKNRPSKSIEEQLRSKLEQAERMCEALMDENEDMKRDLKNMESEIDEMQDNFREEQADEYVSVKKELEQTTKNCRILSFKLKKSERKMEQMEIEKQSGGGTQSSNDLAVKIKQLEDDLKVANEVARRLQAESETATTKKKTPTLAKIGKSNSDGGPSRVSRESLTRGGSQEDPVQLLRDLQDSAEREADLREQLKFAEEEVSFGCLVQISFHTSRSSHYEFIQLLYHYRQSKKLKVSDIELTDIRPRDTKLLFNAGTQTFDLIPANVVGELMIYSPTLTTLYAKRNFYIQFLISNVFCNLKEGTPTSRAEASRPVTNHTTLIAFLWSTLNVY